MKKKSLYNDGARSLRIAGQQSLTGPIAGARSGSGAIGVENDITPLNDEIRYTMDFKEGDIIAGPGAFEWLLPGKVIENEKRVDVDMIAMNADILKNVTRQSFLDSWNQFFKNWREFFNAHSTTAQLLLKGTGPAWRETENYRTQLVTWLEGLKREVPGLTPTLAEISAPGKSGSAPTGISDTSTTGWSTSTIVLLTLIGTGLFVFGGYVTYKWAQRASREVERAKNLLPGLIVPYLTKGRIPASAMTVSHSRAHGHREEDGDPQ